MLIDRLIRINHTKTTTLVTSASHKITAKMRYLSLKITAFDEETSLRHTFRFSDLQYLPPGDPESFAHNLGL